MHGVTIITMKQMKCYSFSKSFCTICCDPEQEGNRIPDKERVLIACDLHVRYPWTTRFGKYTTSVGLVVRVSGYRYRGLGFDSRRYQIF